ncbi:hypothetical protein ACFY7H_29435 [Streptomyces sp. NPDC012794]|uniref:hypothetical protein n=1 Tax=Streptomyces sp. NPDC012794 TaxID=3364850 RepID=UPI0036944CD9
MTAQAAEPASASGTSASTASAAQAGWTFYRAYWTKSSCQAEGRAGKSKHWWKDYNCQYQRGNDGQMKFFLYVFNRVAG